jgi:ribonuclease-3
MNAAEKAYRYLEEQGLLSSIEDVIGQPELEKAINQLQELAQKGYFSLPIYTFSEEYDKDGNPVWFCKCYVREYLTCCMVKNSSKKLAKKEAALSMLKDILKHIKQPSKKSYREDDCNC